jgi:urea-proton symporter
VDQAYWQRAIASQPSQAVKAYIMGGIAWLPIPLTMATAMVSAKVQVLVNMER